MTVLYLWNVAKVIRRLLWTTLCNMISWFVGAGWNSLSFDEIRWEAVLGCFTLSDRSCHFCPKSSRLIGKFLSEKRLYIPWSLYSFSWYAASFLCTVYTQQLGQIHFIGCVLFLPQTVVLSWSSGSPQLWLLDWWCNSWLGQRSLKWITMSARIVPFCKYLFSFIIIGHLYVMPDSICAVSCVTDESEAFLFCQLLVLILVKYFQLLSLLSC